MSLADLSPLADHLWQSTLFVAVAGLLILLLRRNQAQVRYWVWLIASAKFLIPFAAFVTIGRQFGWQRSTSIVHPEISVVIDAIGQPFSRPELAPVTSPATGSSITTTLPVLLLAIWACGCGMHLLAWWVRWRRVAAVVREASPLEDGRELNALRRLEDVAGLRKPVAVVSSDTSFEPGVFGIFKPVLVWPRRIGERLTDGQLDAILSHELCHVRRGDNLASAVHMAVEAVFWFHPLVWWLEKRLVDERELACDEEVIRLGSDPQMYAESILKTCEFCAESPLVCMAGVTGSDLKKRVEAIMSGHDAERLNTWKKLVLATVSVFTLAGPVVNSALNTPRLRAQSPTTAAVGPAFEVASIKPNNSGDPGMRMQAPPGRFTATNVTLRLLIRTAYRVQDFQISGGPTWLNADRFDIEAKADGNPSPDQLSSMLRALLTDRFKLMVHNDTRELPVYTLLVVRNDGRLGSQLRPTDCGRPDNASPPAPPDPNQSQPCGTVKTGPGRLTFRGAPMSQILQGLSPLVNRVVLDRTGLTGNFDLDLEWTPDAGANALPTESGPSIFTALQEQLGLKLDSTKGPVDVLVIDGVKQPTSDDLGLAPTAPPPVVAQSPAGDASGPAFEVASVKPNKSSDEPKGVRPIGPGGRFIATRLTLRELIRLAYGYPTVLMAEQVVSGPSWLDSDYFDIVANVAERDLAPEPNGVPRRPLMMLRNLLLDRFKVKMHTETKQIPIYALVIASGRRSSPQLRQSTADCIYTAAASPSGPVDRDRLCGFRRVGPGVLAGQKVTMELLSGVLAQFPDVGRIVHDRTGLTGGFDIDLKFTPALATAPNPDASPVANPTTDLGGPSIFTALQEQLGLKLESTRGPIEVLVIDSVEQPTPD